MDELPSATFRRVYVRLSAPVQVTSNGHVIGTYFPISTAIDSRYVQAERPGEPRIPAGPTFGHSRPAPKGGSR